jgi:transaldolase
MAIFIDSGDIDEIRRFMKMGILRGVTTNPTILLKDGLTGDLDEIKKKTNEIARIIYPYPLAIEVITNDKDLMLDQARQIASWADNMVVKITIHGPDGELHNLEVIHVLEREHNVRVNVTAMMSAQQCFLAALAGATYVSLFGGRVNNMGYNCIDELRKARNLLDQFGLKAKIIAASTREILNVVEWLQAGAHIVTVLPKFIEGMLIHPYTKETVRQFLQDAIKSERLSEVKPVEIVKPKTLPQAKKKDAVSVRF